MSGAHAAAAQASAPTWRPEDDLRSAAFLRRWSDEPILLVAIKADGRPDEITATTIYDPEKAAGWVRARNTDMGVYFAPNLCRKALLKKARKGDLRRLLAVWSDADPTEGRELAAERTRLMSLADELMELPRPPTVIIDSGGGIQPLWRLAEPLEAKPENIAMMEGLCGRIESVIGGSGTFNADRLLRLPGTINHPNRKRRSSYP